MAASFAPPASGYTASAASRAARPSRGDSTSASVAAVRTARGEQRRHRAIGGAAST